MKRHNDPDTYYLLYPSSHLITSFISLVTEEVPSLCFYFCVQYHQIHGGHHVESFSNGHQRETQTPASFNSRTHISYTIFALCNLRKSLSTRLSENTSHFNCYLSLSRIERTDKCLVLPFMIRDNNISSRNPFTSDGILVDPDLWVCQTKFTLQ